MLECWYVIETITILHLSSYHIQSETWSSGKKSKKEFDLKNPKGFYFGICLYLLIIHASRHIFINWRFHGLLFNKFQLLLDCSNDSLSICSSLFFGHWWRKRINILYTILRYGFYWRRYNNVWCLKCKWTLVINMLINAFIAPSPNLLTRKIENKAQFKLQNLNVLILCVAHRSVHKNSKNWFV